MSSYLMLYRVSYLYTTSIQLAVFSNKLSKNASRTAESLPGPLILKKEKEREAQSRVRTEYRTQWES